ncbi:pilus assembly protein [Rhodoferax sp. AJA081-3]|uniref:pilus assembly protein n=1 Tax=Rhodoferax sp. AJA081-3 TaxID=2752316 RepID=UPI001AE0D216|nr:PilC/PilY family type IV pilus protein [Rhodoferax sp. AJA081-3]QTN29284.1 pilus assembly protein [Rhodoferax sp. AJA081-3]
MKTHKDLNFSFKFVALAVTAFAAVGTSAVTIPNTPLVAQVSATPMVMLVAGKDHKLFYESYNDTSDIDGDGVLDIGFIPNNPNIVYYGLFDPKICYVHNNASDNTGLFTPSSATSDGKCVGKWSGLWLNYVTTSRMDSLRKVLYGGHREVDTASQTILRRAYIPADAHSWGKEYTSIAVNGYDIRDYTPFALPTAADKRHFFGSLTANYSTNCATLNNCSNLPPLLRVRENVGSNKRIWEWASKERPVLSTTLASGGFPAGTGAEKNYTVRVEVCTSTFNSECKLYPNGSYKPVGLLHNYGENDAMLFGLLTGSYDNHMSGGRLRKVVSSFKDEVTASNGQFTAGAKIVNAFNSIRIRGYNQASTTSEYWKSGPYTDSAKAPTEGELVDWGNPIGEMLYEGVRYFSGKKSPTSYFNTATTHDTAVGLSSVTWDDPFESTSAAKAPYCARSSFLTISDIDPSFDSNQVPGSNYIGSFTGDLAALNVKNELDVITAIETSVKGNHFIGESDSLTDKAPTVKNVTSLGTIRGLAPGEPAKQGSYNAAGVAYFAKRSDLRSTLAKQQSIDTFVVALASPLPKISVPLAGGTVTLVPFSRTVAGSGVSATKGNYQPTNQIVDFYVEQLANTIPNTDMTVNGGRYQARFIINYEDVEQGGDHDMDAIAVYDVVANAGGTVTVTVTPTYQAGGMKQNMGYVISGVGTASGVYLVGQDEAGAQNYFLNVPAGRAPGYCDVVTPHASCGTLPTIGGVASTFTFTPNGTGATLLDGPLWYAAKWGSFNDLNPESPVNPANSKPDLIPEWDADANGVPDNYFLVQNPSKLPDQLKKAFDSIAKKNSSASNVIANSSSVSNNTRVFQARFDSSYWSGDLVAYPLTSSGVSISVDWAAKDKLPNDTGRKLYYRSSDAQTKEFLYANLTGTDLTDMGATTAERQDVMSYLRGVRTKELQNSGTFRNRSTTVLGDIVHSSPFYDKASDTVFVGANDGMLHAFKASNGSVAGSAGTELFAFAPAQSVFRLKKLTEASYTHTYYVDGDVVVSPQTDETNNKSYLVAALGRGGKGLFALDVTSPTTFGPTNFLWEYTPKGSAAAALDDDLGLMVGRPTYVTVNCPIVSPATSCKRGAVIIGNGVNSTSSKAVLYIFLLNTNGSIASIKKLDTNVAGDNGLSAPTGFDADNNGTIDYIYAGDLKGNVWKFDVSAGSDSSWSIANTATPMFVAKDALGTPQPITAPMSIGINTISGSTHAGKRYVFFGTGSYFKTGDPADVSAQTWYGLIDEGSVISSRTSLKERTFSATGTLGGNPVRTFSAAVAGDMVGKKGWYIDLTSTAGERMVTKSLLAVLVEPVLFASSIIPDATDPCVAGGKGYVNAMNPFSGGSTTAGIMDVNKNGNFVDDKLPSGSPGGSDPVGSVDLDVGLPSEPIIVGDQLCVGGTSETNPVACLKVNAGNKRKGRISWREIIKD